MLLFVGLASTACQKEAPLAPSSTIPVKHTNQDIEAHYPGFDWDNPNTIMMPVATGQANPNFVSPTVYVPWRSNGGTPLDAGIVNDYHKVDGWELVYDTFAPDNFPRAGLIGAMATTGGQPGGGLYFALYNRYRGVLRYYMYIPPGLFGSSTQLAHGLGIYSSGNTTKMLNFEGVDIVDPNNNSTGFTKTSKDGISATGGWYAMQYQLAYDPAFASTTFPNPGFEWRTRSISTTQIYSEGVEIGTLAGTIVTPKPDFDWLSAALGVVEAVGVGTLDSSKGGITANLANAASGGIAGSALGALQGLYQAINGGPTTQTVNLAINSNITTKGTSTTSQPYQFNSMPFPGQLVGSTNGVPPLVSHPLGLFNISGRPMVTVKTTPGPPPANRTSPTTSRYAYTIDRVAVQALIQANPSVFNADPTGATLINFNAEVLVIHPANTLYRSGNTRTDIGHLSVYSGSTVQFSISSIDVPPPPSENVAVRISFRAAINNTATPNPFVVRTFKADLTQI